MRPSTRSTLALSPVRNNQFGPSTPCFSANALSTCGVSLSGSLLIEMKVTRLASCGPMASRTSRSLRVISGQASVQWVKITLSITTLSFSTSL
ncbi:hypothetical protein D3C76_257820 [compost metagenome]